MKNRFLFVLILPFLLASVLSAQDLPSEEDAKKAVMEKIKMANDRWSQGDPMGFAEVAAEDGTWMDDLGAKKPVVGKEAFTAYLEGFKGQIPPHEKKLYDFIFQHYGDIMIVMYRYQGTMEERGPLPPWKITAVYRYTDGDWFSVHENWSTVEPDE